jgi:hypothetical protein
MWVSLFLLFQSFAQTSHTATRATSGPSGAWRTIMQLCCSRLMPPTSAVYASRFARAILCLCPCLCLCVCFWVCVSVSVSVCVFARVCSETTLLSWQVCLLFVVVQGAPPCPTWKLLNCMSLVYCTAGHLQGSHSGRRHDGGKAVRGVKSSKKTCSLPLQWLCLVSSPPFAPLTPPPHFPCPPLPPSRSFHPPSSTPFTPPPCLLPLPVLFSISSSSPPPARKEETRERKILASRI